MSTNQQLQISPNDRGAALTKDEKRFNRLVERIAVARAQLLAWRDAIPLFHQAYVARIAPLQATLAATRREWVLALDRALQREDWSRPDRKTLQQTISHLAAELLSERGDDAELRALFERHSGIDYDTQTQNELLEMRQFAELITGMDLGDDDIASGEDLVQRMRDGMTAGDTVWDTAQDTEQDNDDAAAHATRAQSRKETARQQRHAAEAERVTQSVRAIYRKLVSFLHPDREPDPQLQLTKTAMLQKVNQAYADNDLLTLLEAQLQIEELDTAVTHAQRVDGRRLKHYNQVLNEQLQQLEEEVEQVKVTFSLDFGMDPEVRLNPRRLNVVIEEQVKLLRADIAEQARAMRRLSDSAAMRRWLKQQRQWLNAPLPF